MRKTFLRLINCFAVVFIFPLTSGFTQTNPEFSQYYQMPYLTNPGLTGIQGFTDVKVGSRQQWTSFPQAPKSYFLGFNHTIGDYSLFNLGKRSNSSSEHSQIARKPGMTRIGLSGHLVQTSFQAFSNLNAGLSYAIHLPVSDQFSLAFGVTTAFERTKANMDELIVRDTEDRFYKNLISSNGSLQYFNLDAGLMLYSDHFFAGYSALRVSRSRLTKLEDSEDENKMNHTAILGYNFNVSSDLEVIPCLIAQTENVAGVKINGNLKARYKSRYWAGLGVAPGRSVHATIGLAPSSLFNFSYSYDSSMGDIKGYSSGTHEIVIGIALFNKSSGKLFLW